MAVFITFTFIHLCLGSLIENSTKVIFPIIISKLTLEKFSEVIFMVGDPHFPVDLGEGRPGLMLLLKINPFLPEGWTILKTEVIIVAINIIIVIVILVMYISGGRSRVDCLRKWGPV